jgi:hypothetical protein
MGIKAMKDTHNLYIDWWKNGDVNLIGRILFLPLIVVFYVSWCLFDLLFVKDKLD